MAPITSTSFPLPPSLKRDRDRDRSIEDRDSRKLSSCKHRRIVADTFSPSRPLWHSEDRIKIIAKQIIINKIRNPDRTPESLLGLFYISAHIHKFQQKHIIDADQIINSSRNLLYNLEISQRSIIYKVLPLMEGELGRKIRFAAAPILYHISSIYTWDKNPFKYSVGEILREGLELSHNLLERNKEEFDFLCGKIESLQHYGFEERKLCMQTWNESLKARLALLEKNYEVGLPQYELIDYYTEDPHTGNYSVYHSTRLFNIFGNTRPEQKPDYDANRIDLNPCTRNPAWIFSATVEGLNVECSYDANGFLTEELRIKDSPIIKMTEGKVPRPTFALLNTLHEPALEENAVDALKKIKDTYQTPEAFQLSYTAFMLELDFLRGRMHNFRPIHWPAMTESLLMKVQIPDWTTFATELEKLKLYPSYTVQDMAENAISYQAPQLQPVDLFSDTLGDDSSNQMTEEEISRILFPESSSTPCSPTPFDYFLSADHVQGG